MKSLLFLGGLLYEAALRSFGWNLALCVGCNLVEADADRKYCLVCYELMIAPFKIGPRCDYCFAPLDDAKLIEKRIEAEPVCDVCFDMYVNICMNDFFVKAQEEFKKNKGNGWKDSD